MTAAAVDRPVASAEKSTEILIPPVGRVGPGRDDDKATLREARAMALTVDAALRRELATRDEAISFNAESFTRSVGVLDRVTFERHRDLAAKYNVVAGDVEVMRRSLLAALTAIQDLQDRTVAGRVRRAKSWLHRTVARLRAPGGTHA